MKMEMITYDKVKQKEMESLFYKPVNKKESFNKTIKEVKTFYEDGFLTNGNKYWTVIIFTDNTAMYIDTNHDVVCSFHTLTYASHDSAFIHSTGRSFIKNGIASEDILNQAAEIFKLFRLEQKEQDRQREIFSLEKKLKELKGI